MIMVGSLGVCGRSGLPGIKFPSEQFVLVLRTVSMPVMKTHASLPGC